MKKTQFFIWILFPLIVSGQGIYSNYFAKVKYWDNSLSAKSLLINVDEEGIIMLTRVSYEAMNTFKNWDLPDPIPFSKIKEIQIKKTKVMGKYALIGGLSGGLLLGVMTLSSNNKSCSGYYCFRFDDGAAFGIGFIMGALGGSLVGILASQFTQIRIPINGKYSEYKRQKKKVEKYILNPYEG